MSAGGYRVPLKNRSAHTNTPAATRSTISAMITVFSKPSRHVVMGCF
jgi:hypothetical protein